MKLVRVKVGPFRSINTPQEVEIDTSITGLVGMNEAGKTVFLKALHKARDALENEKFVIQEDYPRKDLAAYRKRHEKEPDQAVVLTYMLSDEEIEDVNQSIGTEVQQGFEFSVYHMYNGAMNIGIAVDEKPVLKKLSEEEGLSLEAVKTLKSCGAIKKAFELLQKIVLPTEEDVKVIETLKAKIDKEKNIVVGVM